MINVWETRATMISVILVVAYAIVALLWGYVDGRSDAKKNPDPERRSDLAMTWLLAGLFAGVVSGAVAWFIGLFYNNLYVEGLLNELTTFAAFTALLVFLSAIVGVGLGHWLVDRKAPPMERRREDDDRADTDVFAAVRDDRDDNYSTAQTGTEAEPYTSPVAVAEDDETRRDDQTRRDN